MSDLTALSFHPKLVSLWLFDLNFIFFTIMSKNLDIPVYPDSIHNIKRNLISKKKVQSHKRDQETDDEELKESVRYMK